MNKEATEAVCPATYPCTTKAIVYLCLGKAWKETPTFFTVVLSGEGGVGGVSEEDFKFSSSTLLHCQEDASTLQLKEFQVEREMGKGFLHVADGRTLQVGSSLAPLHNYSDCGLILSFESHCTCRTLQR